MLSFMKKYFLGTLMFLGILLTGCTKDNGQPGAPGLQKLILSTSSVTLQIGENCALTVTTEPEDIDGAVLTWTSSDPDIASAAETSENSATVTALATGTASITVSCGDINATCNITVTEETDGPVAEKVTVTPETASVEVGETVQLEASVEPADTGFEITWTSDNPDVAYVDENGLVTGVANGYATISAKAGGKTGSCSITVIGQPLESIDLVEESLNLTEGDEVALTLKISPEGAAYNNIAWTSSAPEIVSVSNGTIKALREGQATIEVDVDGMTDECTVNVELRPLSVGSLIYTDGSYSAVLDPEKELAGIVFYLGDITGDDALLKKEHPECTHGLAVSADEIPEFIPLSALQNNYVEYGKTVGDWVAENPGDYESPTTAVDGANFNKAMGYNNTKAMEAFNAAPENSGYTILTVDAVSKFGESYKAPKGSSGWYVPSVKELALLVNGNDNTVTMNADLGTDNLDIIEEVLDELGKPCITSFMSGPAGSIPVYVYSSTEPENYEMAFTYFYLPGINISQITDVSKGGGTLKVRPIFAF